MKKFFLIAASLLLTLPGVMAQELYCTKAQNIAKQTREAEELTWMQYCDHTTTTVMGVGTKYQSNTLAALTQFKTSTLSQYEGKSISMVAIRVYSTLPNVTVFVQKGSDVNDAEILAEVEVAQLAAGWNIVKFDTPIEIDATTPMGVGYRAYDTAQYPIGFDGKTFVPNTSYLKVADQDYSTADVGWGNLMIRALVDGDGAPLGYNLALDKFDLPRNVALNEPAKVTLRMTNNSFETINNFTYELTSNGNVKEYVATLDEPIANNSSASYSFYTEPVTEETTYEIKITKVNDHENLGVNIQSKDVVPYDASETFDRYILIEKFTGQACGYCPSGEYAILNAIAGHEDRVVRIDHHHGYTKDIFTIEESTNIGTAFGVNSAPQCMVDRRVQEERENTAYADVHFHPGYLTEEMVINEISRPAFVTVEIEPSYNEDTKEATIKVSGESTRDMAGARINVCLVQSGYEAYQNSADASWRHNDFPIDYMTDYAGDEITWNEDGTYEYTYTYTIADEYGKVVSDATKMDVVAFLSYWNDDNKEVLNAGVKKLIPEDSAVAQILDSAKVSFGVAGGQFVVNNSADVEVYTISGIRVANRSLSAGTYIVKAMADGQAFIRKMTIR
ncbi:MAG: Omp28-related outer membrane protein [Lepagella sp.]